MRSTSWLCALAILAAIARSATADASEPTESIVVASGEPAFDAAVVAALASAGLRVVSAAEQPRSLAELAADSRALADREHATGTVWLVGAPGSAVTLVTYDRGVDRLLVRPLPFPAPLDATQAAEAARMARTMLRALRVTPEIDLPPPRAVDAPALRERAALRPVELAATVASPPPASPRTVALAAAVGTRANAIGDRVTSAASFAAIWRPDDLGGGLALGLAPTSDLARGSLTGKISDESLAATVRIPWRPTERVQLAVAAGLAVHRVALAGDVMGASVHSTRYDPAARLGGGATYELAGGAVGLGIDVAADVMLRRQAYDLPAGPSVEVPRLQVVAIACLIARIL